MRTPTVQSRVGRELTVVLGVLGVLAVFDAVLLFVVLLFAGPSPYVGLLMFVVVPLAILTGSAVAWVAYLIVTGRSSSGPT